MSKIKNLRKEIWLLLKMGRYWVFGYANKVFISKSVKALFIWWPEILLYQQRRFNLKSYYIKYFNMVYFVDNWKYIHSITVWLFFLNWRANLIIKKNHHTLKSRRYFPQIMRTLKIMQCFVIDVSLDIIITFVSLTNFTLE